MRILQLQPCTMQKTVFILVGVILICILFIEGKSKKILLIQGSESLVNVTRKIAEACYTNPDVTPQVEEVSSELALANLIEKTCDIVMSSRRMRADEKLRAKLKGFIVNEKIVALDGIVFIVHPSNPITRLSRSNIIDIYSGKNTNWSTYGGPNAKIHITIKDDDGTYAIFKDNIMEQKALTVSTFKMPGSEGIVQTIAQIPNSIAFIPFSFIDTTIKVLDYSVNDIKYVEATKESIKNKSYPLTQPIYCYYIEENAEKAKPFIEAIMSSQGQNILTENGFATIVKK